MPLSIRFAESLIEQGQVILTHCSNNQRSKKENQQVMQTSLKLAEAELAKNKADLAKALKDPAVRKLWKQLVDEPIAPNAPIAVPTK